MKELLGFDPNEMAKKAAEEQARGMKVQLEILRELKAIHELLGKMVVKA